MLTYLAIGPFKDGRYAVAYVTPGCTVLTPVGDYPTEKTAQDGAAQRNIESAKCSLNEAIRPTSPATGFD